MKTQISLTKQELAQAAFEYVLKDKPELEGKNWGAWLSYDTQGLFRQLEGVTLEFVDPAPKPVEPAPDNGTDKV